MTASGTRRRRGSGATPELMRLELINGAFDAMRDEGLANVTARSIASRAACNQASIYYHFGGIVNLQLAAVDLVATKRAALYKNTGALASDYDEFLRVLGNLHRDDLASGFLPVIAPMVIAAASQPEYEPALVALQRWQTALFQLFLGYEEPTDRVAAVAGEKARILVMLAIGSLTQPSHESANQAFRQGIMVLRQPSTPPPATLENTDQLVIPPESPVSDGDPSNVFVESTVRDSHRESSPVEHVPLGEDRPRRHMW